MNSIEKLVNTITSSISTNAYRRGIDIHSVRPKKVNNEWIMEFIKKNGTELEQQVKFDITGNLSLTSLGSEMLRINMFDNKNALSIVSNAFNKVLSISVDYQREFNQESNLEQSLK